MDEIHFRLLALGFLLALAFLPHLLESQLFRSRCRFRICLLDFRSLQALARLCLLVSFLLRICASSLDFPVLFDLVFRLLNQHTSMGFRMNHLHYLNLMRRKSTRDLFCQISACVLLLFVNPVLFLVYWSSVYPPPLSFQLLLCCGLLLARALLLVRLFPIYLALLLLLPLFHCFGSCRMSLGLLPLCICLFGKSLLRLFLLLSLWFFRLSFVLCLGFRSSLLGILLGCFLLLVSGLCVLLLCLVPSSA